MDNKFTDNEIKTTLEYCSNPNANCANCLLSNVDGCLELLPQLALSYINRIETEKESIQIEYIGFEAATKQIIKLTRAKIMEEFINKLKADMEGWIYDFEYPSEQEAAFERIDNLFNTEISGVSLEGIKEEW